MRISHNKLVLVIPAFSASAAGIGLVFAGAQLAPNQGRYKYEAPMKIWIRYYVIAAFSFCSCYSQSEITNSYCGLSADLDIREFKTLQKITYDPEIMPSLMDNELVWSGLTEAQKTSMSKRSDLVERKQYYKIPRTGVTVFFGEDDKLRTVRFDYLYRGQVAGLRIGDPTSKLFEVMGEKKLDLLGYYTYNFTNGDRRYIKFNAPGGQIATIFTDSCIK